jgi:DNA modification methylase
VAIRPWLEGEGTRLYHGDVLDVLAQLPDGVAQTVVTSPPYWALRDYGTGTWTGGDPACQQRVGGQVGDTKAPGAITAGVRPGVDAGRCLECGAVRVDQQVGLEPSPAEYVESLVAVFREVRRVLRDDGTVWLNLGDSYAGAGLNGSADFNERWYGRTSRKTAGRDRRKPDQTAVPDGLKPKDMVGIPWRVALALQADGWYLRMDVVWSKPNPMPESVTDRPTTAHEYLFLLAKRERYFYDSEAIREAHQPDGRRKTVHDHQTPNSHPNYDNMGGGNERWPNGGRNKRSVWTIPTEPVLDAHFATFPRALVRPCVLAGSREGDVVLDPFAGSGTVALVARQLGRHSIGIDLNDDYLRIAARRLASPQLADVVPVDEVVQLSLLGGASDG